MRFRFLTTVCLFVCVFLSSQLPLATTTTIAQTSDAPPNPQPQTQVATIADAPTTFSIAATLTTTLTPTAYLPITIGGNGIITSTNGCLLTSTNTYDLISFQGSPYKNNALTDENADMRLSVLGYIATATATNAPLALVDYNGPADPNAPRLHGIFEPNRIPQFKKNYQRRDWNWNENAPPPYGTPGGANNDWPVSVLDMAATKGENIYIPERPVPNSNLDTRAIVLYADDDEVTLHYGDRDRVDSGYAVYLANFCVDPQLVALYRAQLQNGKRATNRLPAIRNNEKIGTAKSDVITVAVRDQGPFLDPRSRKDWWQGIALESVQVVRVNIQHATGE
jgi:hypothetical protein